MASSKEYLQYILDQLSGLEDITYRVVEIIALWGNLQGFFYG